MLCDVGCCVALVGLFSLLRVALLVRFLPLFCLQNVCFGVERPFLSLVLYVFINLFDSALIYNILHLANSLLC